MTLVLELPAEVEAELHAAAQAAGIDVASFIVAAAREKAKARFDESLFSQLLLSNPEAALDYAVEHTHDHRREAGLSQLTEDQLSRSAFYED